MNVLDPLKSLIIKLLEDEFKDLTIDGIACDPDQAVAFCDHVKKSPEFAGIHESEILRTMLNCRKAKLAPKRGRTGGERLAKKLTSLGIAISPEQFKDEVVDGFASMYKSRPVDRILIYPAQSRAFCDYIRNRIAYQQTPNLLILRTLVNNRKNLRSSSTDIRS